MKPSSSKVGSLVALALFAACAAEEDGVLRSNVERDLAPKATAEQVAARARGVTDFGFDLLRQVRPFSNAVVSPYNVSSAMALLWAGARDETAAQIAAALRFAPETHDSFNALELAIEADDGPDAAVVRNANALWASPGIRPAPEYLEVLGRSYGAGVYLTDFAKGTAAARINDWVSEETRGMIPSLFQQIAPTTRAVLTSATYFAAAWALPFEPALTVDAAFHPAEGESVSARMMSSPVRGGFRHALVEGTHVVALPYVGAAQMVLMMPPQGQLDALVERLDARTLESWMAQLATPLVRVRMPTFEIQDPRSLKTPLERMGVVRPFQTGEELDAIDSVGGLHITDVAHRAMIKLDEKGTVAAAATGIISTPSVPPAPETTITFDRPFVFAIVHDTRAVLFVGVVARPAAPR